MSPQNPTSGNGTAASKLSDEATTSLARRQALDISSLGGIPVLLPTQPGFKDAIKTWSAHQQPTTNDQPHAVFRPETETDISRIVNWARESGYKLTPRSGGLGGACGRGGVCLDMGAFNKVELDVNTETCVLGPGQTWGDVNAKLRDTGYAVLGGRAPHIGVGGYLLSGGVSWLSHEHGIASDPKNLLGATVVLADGRAIHAHSGETATEEEREIMFALRGGGGNFGAVTEFKVRAVKAPKKIFTGQIFYTFDQFPALAPLIANHIAISTLPTSAMIAIFMEGGRIFGTSSFMPVISITIYDALGETHARTNPSSAGGFSWLWDESIQGGPKAEMLHEGTHEDVVNVHAPLAALSGLTRSHQEAITPWRGEIDLPFLERCVNWFESTVSALGEEVGRAAFIAVEPMHPATFGRGVMDVDTAWPHAKEREIVQLAIMPRAIAEDASEEELQSMRDLDAKCIEQIKKAVAEVPLGWRPPFPNYGDAAAGFGISDVYGQNLPRLREIKGKYDPQGVFMSAGLRIPPATA